MTWTAAFAVVSNENEGTQESPDWVLTATVNENDRQGPGDGEPCLFSNTEGVLTSISIQFHGPTSTGHQPGDTIHASGHFVAHADAGVPTEEATTPPVAEPVGTPATPNDGTTGAVGQTFAPGTEVSYPAADPANAPSPTDVEVDVDAPGLPVSEVSAPVSTETIQAGDEPTAAMTEVPGSTPDVDAPGEPVAEVPQGVNDGLPAAPADPAP